MTSIFPLPNGAQLGFKIVGAEHLGSNVRPLVLINGMSLRFEDWEILSQPLSLKRPILLFDHRDIGSSIAPTSKKEDLSIQLMTVDLIALIKHLGWKSIDACGYSMGGVILQQLLLTPSLPFTVAHAVLAATTTKAPHGDPEFVEYMTNPAPPPHDEPLTDEEKMRAARPMVEMGYDKEWLSDPKNREYVEKKLPSQIIGRPSKTIMRQAFAVRGADHRPNLSKVPSSIPILVIHGKRDRIIHYAESEYILRGIKHARRVIVDESRAIKGSVPSIEYGHTWFDYFEPQVWVDVVETFLNDGTSAARPRL